MSRFVLTAQLQLQAPNNVRQVVNQIQGQLAGVNVPINVQNAASATRQINQIRAATNDATTAAERMGTAFGVSLKRFASFSIATRAVGLFTNSLAGAIRDAIAFERELVKVAQVSNQSISSLKGLTSTITELATSLGVESKSLLEVSTILKQAGLSADDTSIALRTLAKAALAPNFDSITETTEGAIAILAQFGLGVQALEGQLSSIDAVAGAFAVEASDLIDVIRRAGGVFKSSGGDLNELLALFTSVRATTRESAESIGTGLRTIFTRIQRPQTIEYLKEFGIELVDLEGRFVGPFEAVKRLSAALAGLGEGDLTFIRVAEELGGFRQIGKVLPLLQQFALAQNALNVAQKAGDGLTTNAITAQQALAIRITKVKEEFLAFVRGVTESRGFQLFVNTALNLASAFIKIGEALTPVIPLLTAMMAINISRGIGSFLTSIPRGLSSTRFSGGGRVLGFEKGGMVPGVGNKDTVPAMLTPGEVVMNRSAVQKYGAGNLVKMNNRAEGGPITVEELKAINPNSVQPDYRNEQLAKFKTGENDNTWSKYKMDGKFGKVRTTAIKYMQPNDKVFGEVNYIPVQDPNRVEVEKYFGNISFPRGTKFINPKDKKIATAYEAYVESKMEGIGARFTGTYDPLDFETGDAKFYSSEENIAKYASINKVLSKRLRHENVKKRIDWNPSTPETKELQTTNIYHPTDLSSNNNLKSRLTEWLLLNQSQRTSQAIKAGQDFNIGGLVQRFEEGGVAQRRVGIIDSDVLRDKKNAARVAEGMKLLDAKSEADYAIKLSKLAGEARQSGSLSKFSVMAGAAANRKSSVATGRGANDNATLRKTTRKQILHPDDLKDVDQVMSLTTTLKESKLDYMGMADRIYVKDSSTEDEQKLVKLFERQRNLQKDPTLYGRETGTTEGLNPDYGLQTASLISQFGTTEDRTNKGKVMTLGEKTDQSGTPSFQIRRKRLEELPELVSAKGQFPGAASPLTRGHAETAVGTLLAKVREKYPDATHKDLLFALAPDLSLSGGSQGREHGSRYGEYPASFRRDLIKLALPEMMISSADSPSQTGINSRIAEIEKGATGRRRFAVMEKDAPVVISKAENENPEGVMERYRAAGLTPYNIARSADTEGDSISGTATRQAVIDKDYAKLDLAVLPQVGSAIKANQPQLRNRRMMVPLVQQALDIFTQANASKINEQVDGILQNASGGPFTRMTPKFKEAHPNLVKQIQQLRKNRDIFERESFLDPAHELIRIISNRYPDIYGLDVARKEPVDVSVTEDMIKQHIVDSSKLSSYFKPGLSFSGDGIQLSPTLQKVKDAVEKEVKSEVAAEPTVDKEIVAPSSRADIFKVLSRDEAAIASGVDKIKTYDIMGLRRELTTEEQRVKDAVKDAYVQKIKNKSRAAKATTTKLRGKGLEFGAAGLFGKSFAAQNIKIESDKLSSSRMVRVMSGVMDQATATRLSTTMSQGVSDIISQGTNIVKSGVKPSTTSANVINGLNANTNATIQGGLIEQIIQQLGGPGAVKGKGFDFPDGLKGAAKYFNIDPNIPTDVKRTLSGPSTIKDNIVTYLKNVMGYKLGGQVYDLQKGTGLSNGEFDEIVKYSNTNNFSMDEFKTYLAKRLQDKKNKSGLMMNPASLLNAITPENPRASQSQLDLARSLMGSPDAKYNPKYDNVLRKASGGLAEAVPAKDYGKIGLRSDGSTINATYFKNDKREGYVSAYKMRDYLYYVGLSKATQGYGPRLYDAVMEEATAKGAMLTSDRSSISGAAKKVWEYYFKNRGDVKKTPLKPDDWVRNQAEIDPKLYGKPETWPPPTDPAWILQSGYSKSPSLINDKNSVIRMGDSVNSGAMALQYFSRANGGRLGFETGGTVPALVSNGEAYVPPAMAKKIGYGRLNRMNQADRNGMGRFSEGGISVFKGPGTGTSDSIPANLPVGSFIVRAKATKALGLNKGGRVQKFADGGTPIQQRVSALYDQREVLKERSKIATGTESTQIAKQMQDIEKEMEKLEESYKKLTDIIDKTIKIESNGQKRLDKANQDLIKGLENKTFGGKKFDELNEEEQFSVIGSARRGVYKDAKGNDEFKSQNQTIDTVSRVMTQTRADREVARQTLSSKFGGIAPTFNMEARRRGDTPFPYPTPSGGTPAGGTPAGPPDAGASSGTPASSGGDKSNKSMFTFSQALTGASAALNGLIQTAGGTDDAFSRIASAALSSVTAISSSLSILESVAGIEIKGFSDIATIPKKLGESFSNIGATLDAKISEFSGGRISSSSVGLEKLFSSLGAVAGVAAITASAFSAAAGILYSTSTTVAQYDKAMADGNIALVGTLSARKTAEEDIISSGGIFAGGIVAVAAAIPLLIGAVLSTIPPLAGFSATLYSLVLPIAAAAAAIVGIGAIVLYATGNLEAFANGVRDVASYLTGGWIQSTATIQQFAQATAATSHTMKLMQDQAKQTTQALKDLSEGRKSAKEVLNQFSGQAQSVANAQSMATRLPQDTAQQKKDRDTAIKQANENRDKVLSEAAPAINAQARNIAVAGGNFADFFASLPKELQAVYNQNPEELKLLKEAFGNTAKDVEIARKQFEAMNLGLRNVTSITGAAVNSVTNFTAGLQVGNLAVAQSANTLAASLTAAGANISTTDFNNALNDVAGTMASLGASDQQISKFKENLTALAQVQRNASGIFDQVRDKVKARGYTGMSAKQVGDDFKQLVDDQLKASGIGEEARKRIGEALGDIELTPDEMAKIAAGDYSFLTKKIEEAGVGVSKEGMQFVSDLQKVNAELSPLYKQRIESERALVEAQRQAISLTLEGLDIQAKYGGKAVTPEIRRQAALESANAGRRAAGLNDVRGSDPASLRAGLNQIRGNFSALEQKALQRKVSGQEGVRDEGMRENLKKAQQDQVKLIKDLISAEEEQLKITKEKNKLEKDSLESLLAGDIDKFFEQQAAVGATAAIASGNRAAIGQFGGQALGGAYQNLQRQKEAGVTELFGRRIGGSGGLLESSAMASLGARGVQNPRMAQILAGTTPEEEASNRRLREYGGLLGEAGAAGAEMAALEVTRAEMNIATAELKIQNAGLNTDILNNQPQNRSRGGIVYASKGQLINFVPKGTDTVPAMLTPGEFVVNRGAVNRGDNLSFLRAINNGQYTANAQRLNSNTSSIPNILKQLTSSPQALQTQDTQRKVVQNERNISNVNFDVQKLSKELGKFMSGFDGFMENFSEQVGKLGNTEVSHKLGDVNLNINGGQFLQSMADGLKQQLMEDLGQKLQGIKVNNVGNIKFGRTSVL
jgi:TP901 family phage tail tape measure protein